MKTAYQIDNNLYDSFGADWWNPMGQASLLHELNPVRFEFFRQALGGHEKLANLKTLDVGCGGGLLAEQFALAGAQVTGIDLSASTLEVARQHALQHGLEIDYRQASAERLPFPDNAFDLVVCCDFLEHVSDRLELFLTEMARVLRPGGVFLYDTVNRTWASRLIAVWILQDWLQIVPRRTHTWPLFIKPPELEKALRQVGIEPQGRAGLLPSPAPPRVVYNVLRHRRVGGFRLSPKSMPLTYLGYGRKGKAEEGSYNTDEHRWDG